MINSTQQSVDIAGIKDGVVIMQDGSYRMVLQASPVNFALKSEQEQTSLIFQYQSFLNSLHFPIEIVIRSKRLDLTPYLNKIQEITKNEQNELIKMQSGDYIDFVGKLINIANIMKKSFYVVVSYNPITVHQVSVIDKLFGKKNEMYDHIKISDQEFKNCSDKLRERANIVASGLGGMGLHCFQLSTEELIELFYQVYNPDESAKERIENMDILASPIIASEKEVGTTDTNLGTEDQGQTNMIDNGQIVQEQQKQVASVRKQNADNVSQAEKSPLIGNETKPMPSATTPAQQTQDSTPPESTPGAPSSANTQNHNV